MSIVLSVDPASTTTTSRTRPSMAAGTNADRVAAKVASAFKVGITTEIMRPQMTAGEKLRRTIGAAASAARPYAVRRARGPLIWSEFARGEACRPALRRRGVPYL